MNERSEKERNEETCRFCFRGAHVLLLFVLQKRRISIEGGGKGTVDEMMASDDGLPATVSRLDHSGL